ncbi:helix-turn-helix domain-containing protein [Actibacterium pelagium]|uniref:DNA-binding protein n=1 Tax=Actibacterium pelagium TaxID=2029103 RepID=A0A917AIT9_9RHOB|nr:XRE family transcriptional regulator [Actibacterium pelagium]GGE52143.1 DNA-binding protein [Actibacterium pelagium]
MTEKDDDILSRLPARLKEARREKGLSLEAVAKLSGVSRSMVSQIERGESSPTIATLWNLTSALQVDFAGLLDETAKTDRIEVIRRDQAPTIDNRGEGCRIRILSPPEEAGRNEVYQLELSAGGSLDSQPHKRGTVEHLTVLDGMVEVTSGDATEQLATGDSARYAADTVHSIRSIDGSAVAFLLVFDDV